MATAILNVQKGSFYAHLNGYPFPIAEQTASRGTLNIYGTNTDFTTKEVVLPEKVTLFVRWFNWRPKMGSLGSFETSLLDTYRLASAHNREKLATVFPQYFVEQTHDNAP